MTNMRDLMMIVEGMKNRLATLIEHDPRRQERARRMMKNPAFRHWFGSSMVVDQDGLPYMCYHGSGAVFSAFQHPTGEHGVQLGRGIYVAVKPVEADRYGNLSAPRGSPNIMPLYVSAQKVIHADELWSALADGLFTRHLAAFIGANYDPDEHGEDFDPDDKRHILAQDRAISELRHDRVFDGIADHNQIMVFEPWQVKSAYGNKGGFTHSSSVTEGDRLRKPTA